LVDYLPCGNQQHFHSPHSAQERILRATEVYSRLFHRKVELIVAPFAVRQREQRQMIPSARMVLFFLAKTSALHASLHR